jgi:hypothetical protein
MSRTKDLVIETVNARNQCKHLSWESALVSAQSEMVAVSKDSTNSFHKYKYASADDVIAAARVALNREGLALIRSWKVVFNEAGIWVDSQFSLVHDGSAGVFNAGTVPFPVIEDKGRPLDKALAGALTTSLAYFLRDLLLIPKDDEHMDKRDDTNHLPNAPAKNRWSSSKEVFAPTALIGMTGAVALNKRLNEHGLQLAKLISAMESALNVSIPSDMMKWKAEWLSRIDGWILKQLTVKEVVALHPQFLNQADIDDSENSIEEIK